ncbi:MAG: RNA-binding protein [Bdellovibrionales bacterium]|nr:RNA-binding protein [Bdellovibrionales bacterium]
MGTKLFIGNLAYSATEEGLNSVFSQAGGVTSVKIVTDRETGRSRGFAFVEMASEEDANNAVAKLNGHNFEGRPLSVSEARPQAPRTGGGGGRSFGGGGGGGFGGGGGGRGGFGGGGGGGRGRGGDRY